MKRLRTFREVADPIGKDAVFVAVYVADLFLDQTKDYKKIRETHSGEEGRGRRGVERRRGEGERERVGKRGEDERGGGEGRRRGEEERGGGEGRRVGRKIQHTPRGTHRECWSEGRGR